MILVAIQAPTMQPFGKAESDAQDNGLILGHPLVVGHLGSAWMLVLGLGKQASSGGLWGGFNPGATNSPKVGSASSL